MVDPPTSGCENGYNLAIESFYLLPTGGCKIFVCLLAFFSLYLFEDLLEDRPLQAEGTFLHNFLKIRNKNNKDKDKV